MGNALLRLQDLWISKFIATGSGCQGPVSPARHLNASRRQFSARPRIIQGGNPNGGSQTGAEAPNFQRKSGKNPSGKSGLFGPDWSLFRVYRGLFGADWDRFLHALQPRGGSRNSPERAFLGPIGAFWAKPPFAKPPFGFPQSPPLDAREP